MRAASGASRLLARHLNRTLATPAHATADTPRRDGRVVRICPACGTRIMRPSVFTRHTRTCCPDVIPPASWREAEAAGVGAQDELLRAAAAAEADLRRKVLTLTFGGGSDTPAAARRASDDVAAELGLPPARVEAVLAAAIRATPLTADTHPVTILHEDDHVVALAKPAGIITAPKHRYEGGSLHARAYGALGFPPLPVHRLDQDTSGVVLMAKTSAAAAALQASFAGRQVSKRYVALVVGVPAQERWSIDLPISRHTAIKVARVTGPPDGQDALTRFAVVSSTSDPVAAGGDVGIAANAPTVTAAAHHGASLVACAPVTGRTHQIRVHAAASGHPLIGDTLYGASPPWAPRLLLHAATMEVPHPDGTGRLLRVAAPLPPEYEAAVAAAGLACPGDLFDLPVL